MEVNFAPASKLPIGKKSALLAVPAHERSRFDFRRPGNVTQHRRAGLRIVPVPLQVL